MCNEVTDRPQPDMVITAPPVPLPAPHSNDITINDENESDTSITLPPISITQAFSTTLNALDKSMEIPGPSVEIPSSSRSHTSIFKVALLPHIDTVKRSTRKKKRSDIISSSPYKQGLEREMQNKNRPRKVRLNISDMATNTKPKRNANSKPKRLLIRHQKRRQL